MAPETVAGMNQDNVRYNIYAFRQDLKRARRKHDLARTEHMRAYWKKKAEEAQQYLTKNQQRLHTLTTKEEENHERL